MQTTTHQHSIVADSELPTLHLDGKYLRNAFETLANGAESIGGIEFLVQALEEKSILFQRTFASSADDLQEAEFLDACTFIPTVRRRLKRALTDEGFNELKFRIKNLLTELSLSNVDQKFAEFKNSFPNESNYRWVHDLAAEIVHYRDPQTYPLMTRWIWDNSTNSGVLFEIWFREYKSNALEIENSVYLHLSLRQELGEFLRSEGVYANIHFVIDSLCAWIYGVYIGAQGGSFLKSDFTRGDHPIQFALRMLGLDGVIGTDGKTRLVLPSGERYTLTGAIDAVTH